MVSNIDEIIHLNDFTFIQLCNEKYGVNRGVYNTIDCWFFNHGIENILERRKNIIFFLEFINKKQISHHPKQKFGSGGLSIKLQEYFATLDVNNFSKMISDIRKI